MLTGESGVAGGTSAPALSNSYGFDAMGNRVSTKNEAAHTQVSSGYNALNQLASQTFYSTSSGTPVVTGKSALSYDGDGNMALVTAKDAGGAVTSQTTYSYDDSSRLVGIETPGVSRSQFFYDGLSRLRVSRSWLWQGGAWVQNSEKRRVYLGMDVVQERDGNNAVVASYTRTGNISGLLARTTSSGSVFYGYDGGGNVTSLTDSTGAVVGSYTYDAFGNTVASSGAKASENPYRFSTKEQIGGMYAYGFRFYSPGLGRWINRDPIRESGGTNLYEMVGNNPVNGVDAYGLAERPKKWGHNKIAIVFNAFIPTYTAQAPVLNNGITGSFKGDNREFQSDGGSYRTMHTIVMNTKTGQATAWEFVGNSTLIERGFGLLPDKSNVARNRSSLQTWVNGDNCRGWDIHIEGNAKDGMTPETITAGITYRIQMHVSPSGAVSGFHIGHIDSYPAYEIWEYGNFDSSSLIFGQTPNPAGSVFNLVPGIGGSGSSWK